MIVNDRELIISELFYRQLALIQTYYEQFSPKRSRQLTSKIVSFVTDTIATSPYAFAEYERRKTEQKAYRRAIVLKQYAIIYKVSDEKIIILCLYHTSQNPANIDLGEDS